MPEWIKKMSEQEIENEYKKDSENIWKNKEHDTKIGFML